MAETFQNLSGLDDVMYEFWKKGGLNAQYSEATPFSDDFVKTSEGVEYDSARGWLCHIHVQDELPQGLGSRAEEGYFPRARKAAYGQVKTALRYNYGKATITGQAFEQGASNAAIQVAAKEISGLLTAKKLDYARQLWGDGSGACGRIASEATPLITMVENKFGPGTAGIWANMEFDINTVKPAGTSGDRQWIDPNTAGAGSEEVADGSVASVNSRTVFAADASVAAASPNSWVFRRDSRGLEMTGLSAIIDGATATAYSASDTAQFVSELQGRTIAAYPKWAAHVDQNGETLRDITLEILYDCLQQSWQNGGIHVDVLATSPKLLRRVAELFYDDIRRVQKQTLTGGWSAVEVENPQSGKTLTIKTDFWVPRNCVFGIAKKTLTFYERPGHPKWLTAPGSEKGYWRLTYDDTHRYQAVYTDFRELGCSQRLSNFVIRDLNET